MNTIDQLSMFKKPSAQPTSGGEAPISAVSENVHESHEQVKQEPTQPAVTAEEIAGLLSPELSAAQREIHTLKAEIEFHKSRYAEQLKTLDASMECSERLNLRLETASNMYDSLEAQNATLTRAVSLLERKIVLSDFAAVNANNTIASLLKLLNPVMPNVNALNICDLVADLLSVVDERFSANQNNKHFWDKLASEVESVERVAQQEVERLVAIAAEGEELINKGV